MQTNGQPTATLIALKGTAAQIELASKVRAKALAGIDAQLVELEDRIAFESDPAQTMAPVDSAYVSELQARFAYWVEVRKVIAERLSNAPWLLDHRGGIYPVLVDLPYFVDTVAKLAGITKP